jgi:hypothetical protein
MTTPKLPEMGEYEGKPISLEHAQATLSPEQLAEVFVDVPGRGRIRPWRFVQPSDDVTVDDDGAVVIG